MSFLHGVQFIELSNGPVPIIIVKSGVIALIGTAPQWAVPSSAPVQPPAPNTPTLVSSARDASQFGPLVQGYSIPYALQQIQAQGGGQVIVINVFNPSTHKTAVTNAALTLPASPAAQVLNLGHMGIASVVVKNSAGSTTYVENTDYTVDYLNGLIYQKSSGAITAGEALEVSYAYADPSMVEDSDIIGAVTDGVYTGIQALALTMGTMGFNAKVLIAPGFSKDASVQAAMLTMAATLRAMALIDSAPTTQVATAISNRGTSGQAFYTSSERAILCFPNQTFYDTGIVPTGVTFDTYGNPVQKVYNANSVGPFSPFVAGAIAARDAEVGGPWQSPSNFDLIGALGPDVSIYMSYIDPNSDDNSLNAAGILTIFGGFGTGVRTWGNRSAGYPTKTDLTQFIPVRRTMDMVEDSVQAASLQFIDKPITNGLIDSIVQTVQAFLNSLVQQGGLVAGSITYLASDNPALSVAAGQLVFELSLTPPPPAEEITFNTSINLAPLGALGQTAGANA